MTPVGDYRPEWQSWPYKKCPTCGLEWRGAEICPHCAHIADLHGLTLDYENAAVERDEARDWCRKLVAIVKAFQKHRHLNRCVEYAAITGKPFCIAECADGYAAIARALPPEFRAEIEEAK